MLVGLLVCLFVCCLPFLNMASPDEIVSLRASPAAVLSMWPCKIYISHPSLVIYVFGNPTHETKTRTANRWGTTNSKTLWSIIMMGQSETLSNGQITFITLFSAGVAQSCFTFHQPLQASDTIMWSQNHFLGPNGHIFDFSSSKSSCAGGSHTEHRWRCS